MTLDQLRAFCAVVETGGFRAAADSLYRTQSAISVAIRNLEAGLGLILFNRSGYRPELTEAGAALYNKAAHLLAQAEEIRSLATHLAAGLEAQLSLAITGIVPLEPITEILNRLSTEASATQISLQIENLGGAMERLLDDDADIAITDVFDPQSGLEFFPLTRVEFVSVVPPGSPFAKIADTLTERDVAGSTMIVVRDTSTHSERVSKGLVEGTQRWVVNDFMMKRRMIRSGTGWGRMPHHMVADDLRSGELVMLHSPDFPVFSATVYMVRKKGRAIGPVERALWQHLADYPWPEHD